MSLTVLQILLGCGVLCAIATFIIDRPPNLLVNVELLIFVAYEICFCIFHPLVAVIWTISFAFMVLLFYKDDEKLNATPNWLIYIFLGAFVISSVYEMIETVVGRLF